MLSDDLTGVKKEDLCSVKMLVGDSELVMVLALNDISSFNKFSGDLDFLPSLW